MTRKRARKILMSIGTSRNHANWGLTAKPRWKTNAGVVEDTLTITLYAKLLRARMEGKKDDYKQSVFYRPRRVRSADELRIRKHDPV